MLKKRRLLGLFLLLAPSLVVLAVDLALRAPRFQRFEAYQYLTYVAAWLEGALLWGALLYAGARRHGWARWISRISFVVFFTLALGGQLYFFEQYNAYLNLDVSLFATHFVESVLNQLWADRGNYLARKLPVLLLALLLLSLAIVFLRPRRSWSRRASIAAPLFLVLCFFLPTQYRHLQASTPDALYLHALGGMFRTQLGLTDQSHQLRPRLRKSKPVPALTSQRPRRNLVFIILESVRKDAVCNAYQKDCQRTPFTNQLFPERIAFSQLRALDSSTAISLAVLWTGLSPLATRDELHEWPLLFDYAKSAGYQTAYWTSQNLMFGNLRLWVQELGTESFLSATDVEPEADIDLGADEEAFVDAAVAKLAELQSPYFLTIQLSNGHYPYLVRDSGPTPFQPASSSKDPSDTEEFFNHYRNAIYQQDRALARLLQALLASPGGKDAIYVLTSDHGEAFREHYQLGHTFSLFDEEILVPAWISGSSLSASERQSLQAAANEFAYHPDLSVTILDLLGVAQAPQLARYREKWVGHSLMAPPLQDRVMALSNCAGVWSCAYENWGVMRGPYKLEARAYDPSYHCYHLLDDPKEKHDLGEANCPQLRQRASEIFGRLPGKQ